MAKIIDLSKLIEYRKDDPFYMKVKIKHKPHPKSKFLIRFIGLPKRLFPKGWPGWADDMITQMGVHSTTHLDAPWHFGPTVNGEKAKTIDEVPLEWCYGEGIVLDMTHKEDNDPVTVHDIEGDLKKSGAQIKEGTIVLVRTDCDRFQGQADFPAKGPGVTGEATEWLIDKGVKVMGIDQWGWDMPLKAQAGLAKKTGNTEIFWEAHRVGTRKEYCHIEQLVNLKALPSFGFKVALFPLKIKGASAGPARVVGIID